MLLGVFLPFFHFLFLASSGRKLGPLGVQWATLANMLLMVGLNVYNFILVVYYQKVFVYNIGDWLSFGLIELPWMFRLDFLAVSMLAMVSIISGLVHCYSIAYMQTDPSLVRFISLLSFFTFFMFVLVSASNLLVFFLGWEGVGICSYLLINFWYTRVQANKAAIKALLMNRVGDIGFLVGLLLVLGSFRSGDFSVVAEGYFDWFNNMCHIPGPIASNSTIIGAWFGLPKDIWLPVYNVLFQDVVALAFFIGVMGKSAQLGLHTWLPAAMEGPTPVSALIHAATMVTAGIFLMIRGAFIFDYSDTVAKWVVIFGVFTALASAFTAIFLYDIKRIIAYSTCSQLGYMAAACGLSQYDLSFFHLINHAFFKAILFITAGAIIHSMNNEQDIRKLFNIAQRAPFLHSSMLVGTVAIMGLPFLSGFYSKDIIMESLYTIESILSRRENPLKHLMYGMILCATACTGIYSFRLYYYLFLKQGIVQHQHVGGSFVQPFFIQLPLLCIMLGSLFSGFFFNDLFVSSNVQSAGVTQAVAGYTSGTINGRKLFWEQFYKLAFITNMGEDVLLSYRGLGTVGESELDFFFNVSPVVAAILNTALLPEFLPGFIKLLPLVINLIVLVGGLVFVSWYQHNRGVSLGSLLFENLRYLQGGVEAAWRLSGFWLGVWMYWRKRGAWIAHMAYFNFYFNETYNYLTVQQLNYYYTHIFLNLDKGVFEFFGPTGITRLYKKFVKQARPYYSAPINKHLFNIYCYISVLFYIVEILG